MRRTYKTPDSACTTIGKRYVREWKALGSVIERKLGVRVVAFDPGFAICTSDGKDSCDLPLWLARKIAGMEDA